MAEIRSVLVGQHWTLSYTCTWFSECCPDLHWCYETVPKSPNTEVKTPNNQLIILLRVSVFYSDIALVSLCIVAIGFSSVQLTIATRSILHCNRSINILFYYLLHSEYKVYFLIYSSK